VPTEGEELDVTGVGSGSSFMSPFEGGRLSSPELLSFEVPVAGGLSKGGDELGSLEAITDAQFCVVCETNMLPLSV
jgi:hypothetical protein